MVNIYNNHYNHYLPYKMQVTKFDFKSHFLRNYFLRKAKGSVPLRRKWAELGD